MSTDDTWTISLNFKADDLDAAGLLREALHTIAENFRGISDVDVEASHPDRFAWVNLSGRLGDGKLIDLHAEDDPELVLTRGEAL